MDFIFKKSVNRRYSLYPEVRFGTSINRLDEEKLIVKQKD